jgi:hypothetical protein
LLSVLVTPQVVIVGRNVKLRVALGIEVVTELVGQVGERVVLGTPVPFASS